MLFIIRISERIMRRLLTFQKIAIIGFLSLILGFFTVSMNSVFADDDTNTKTVLIGPDIVVL
jgi:hypothetical protein